MQLGGFRGIRREHGKGLRAGSRRLLLMGESEGRARYSGGQNFDWTKKPQEDLTAFGIITNLKEEGVGGDYQGSGGMM